MKGDGINDSDSATNIYEKFILKVIQALFRISNRVWRWKWYGSRCARWNNFDNLLEAEEMKEIKLNVKTASPSHRCDVMKKIMSFQHWVVKVPYEKQV